MTTRSAVWETRAAHGGGAGLRPRVGASALNTRTTRTTMAAMTTMSALAGGVTTTTMSARTADATTTVKTAATADTTTNALVAVVTATTMTRVQHEGGDAQRTRGTAHMPAMTRRTHQAALLLKGEQVLQRLVDVLPESSSPTEIIHMIAA